MARERVWRADLGSPQFFIAITGSSGRTIVVSTDDGTLVQELMVAQPFTGLAWTTPDQLLTILNGGQGTHLQAIDVFTGNTRIIADLSARTQGWWMTASGSDC